MPHLFLFQGSSAPGAISVTVNAALQDTSTLSVTVNAVLFRPTATGTINVGVSGTLQKTKSLSININARIGQVTPQIFQFAEADMNGDLDSGTIVTISPSPTYVDYPEKFTNEVVNVRGSGVVVRRPLKDSRARRWIWEGYLPTMSSYQTMYNQLLNLHHNLRLAAGKSEYVYLYENASGMLTYLVWNGTSFDEVEDFIKVKVIDIIQDVGTTRSGHVRYTTSLLFMIAEDDPNWNEF